jgi:hypothetical protein
MATPSARGRAAKLYAKSKADLATPASGDFQALTFYSETLERQNDMPNDDELGLDYHNERDETDPAPGLPTGSGTITVPADLNQLLFWMTQLLGAPDSTEDDDVHTHVFQSGKAELPYTDIEIPMTGGRFKQAACSVNEFTFGVEKAEGYRRFGFGLLARDVVMAQASAAGDPAPVPPRLKLPASKGIARINSTIVGQLIGGEFTFNNNNEAETYADDTALVGAMPPGNPTLTGTPRFRFMRGENANGALEVFDDHNAHFDFEVEYRLNASASLLIAMPRCYGPRVTPTVSGPGAIEFGASLSARQSTSGPMMTVTLKNALAALPTS